jgi:hypothetical protein
MNYFWDACPNTIAKIKKKFFKKITDEMLQFMRDLSHRVPIAVVGGSDFSKIFEQLPKGEDNELHKIFSFIFAENGLMGFEGFKELPKAV